MRPLEKLVSACCVAMICAGTVYAYDREQLRDADLNPVFQQINRESFAHELSGVTVEWADLDQERGESRKLGDGEFLILLDHNENTFITDVRQTLQHEACHVFVDWQERKEHGPAFQECMNRFR